MTHHDHGGRGPEICLCEAGVKQGSQSRVVTAFAEQRAGVEARVRTGIGSVQRGVSATQMAAPVGSPPVEPASGLNRMPP